MFAESVNVPVALSGLLLSVADLVIPESGSTKVLSLERRGGLRDFSFSPVLVGTPSVK
jgi:hypothetical protein